MTAKTPPSLAMAAALLLSLTGGATAHEFNLGDLFVDHPHIPLASAEADSALGLLSIHNRTDETEQLTAVRGTGVTLMHHVEVGDEMRLVPVDRLAIPRGTTLTFSPDALHLVFETEAHLSEGDLIPTKFVFENAGEMDVIFVVEADDHTGH